MFSCRNSHKRGDVMIDLSFIGNMCSIISVLFGVTEYIFSHRKQISHLLQQVAKWLRKLTKR